MKKIKEMDIFKISEKTYMLNYLTGACDIITNEIHKALESECFDELMPHEIHLLKQRKYIFESNEEYDKYVKELNDFLKEQDRKAYPNFVIIPSYDCNLSCSYCFESNYKLTSQKSTSLDIDLIFQFIEHIVDDFKLIMKENEFEAKKIRITLMGGEPLLRKNYAVISELLKKIFMRGYSYHVITNGVEILEFIDLFKTFPPLSIQITLDGPKNIHDQRRCNKNKSGTFDSIIKNIHMLLIWQINVQIRINIDSENILELYKFSRFLNSEFGNHHCLSAYIYPIQDGGCLYESNILSEEEIIKSINHLASQGQMLDNIKKIFHGSFLFDSIKSNIPFQLKFKNCSAFKKQYILDCNNDVYKCWYGIGNKNRAIGNLNKNITSLLALDNMWQNRSIISLEICNNCKYRYLCGTGCLSHIYKNICDLKKSRCLNFKKLLENQLKLMLYTIGVM